MEGTYILPDGVTQVEVKRWGRGYSVVILPYSDWDTAKRTSLAKAQKEHGGIDGWKKEYERVPVSEIPTGIAHG